MGRGVYHKCYDSGYMFHSNYAVSYVFAIRAYVRFMGLDRSIRMMPSYMYSRFVPFHVRFMGSEFTSVWGVLAGSVCVFKRQGYKCGLRCRHPPYSPRWVHVTTVSTRGTD